jgi:hypothetical protein
MPDLHVMQVAWKERFEDASKTMHNVDSRLHVTSLQDGSLQGFQQAGI